MSSLDAAQKRIGYCYQEPSLLKKALTHSSYANEKKTVCNERLEFLGDSVLSLIISDYIFHKRTDVDEGVLTKIRASLVCEQSLARIAKKIDLGDLIFLGRGEELTGGRKRASVVSDAFEAVLASIYLDGGLESAKKWLLGLMREEIESAQHGNINQDFKTMLQEKCQKGNHGKVTYRLENEFGQDHNKHFQVRVYIDAVPHETGEGSSKKEAEQQAARRTLEKIR